MDRLNNIFARNSVVLIWTIIALQRNARQSWWYQRSLLCYFSLWFQETITVGSSWHCSVTDIYNLIFTNVLLFTNKSDLLLLNKFNVVLFLTLTYSITSECFGAKWSKVAALWPLTNSCNRKWWSLEGSFAS